MSEPIKCECDIGCLLHSLAGEMLKLLSRPHHPEHAKRADAIVARIKGLVLCPHCREYVSLECVADCPSAPNPLSDAKEKR